MEKDKVRLTFPSLYKETVRKFGDFDAYAFVGENPINYRTAYQKINALSFSLEKADIKKGDTVAIFSSNMPNWAIAYFGITCMGAVAIPILPDFSTKEVSNVIQHAEAKAIFISAGLTHKLDIKNLDTLDTVISIEDFSLIANKGCRDFHYDPEAAPASSYEVEEDDLASIVYTSGTTGRSKGVMLTHKNLCFNAFQGKSIQDVNENDRFLSILPLSHTYENTLGLIIPMISGSCVYYLKKPPTASVLIPALQKIKPTTILSVPLIIEKIYYKNIKPALTKNFLTRFFYRIPVIRKRMNLIAGKKLKKTFGGEIRFFGIGGAKLNTAIEKFLSEAKFPYAIGYGLTETSPLLAGTCPFKAIIDSTGPAIEGVEIKINNPDAKGEGEIWVRGANVMKGYYKEPEKTAEVITPDGWFKTGDLGMLNSEKYLFIKGRSKNMIVGASGENIYPEEIESVINNFYCVQESLVIQKKGKLVAMVHLNMEEFEKKYPNLYSLGEKIEDKTRELLEELREYVNANVSKYCRISYVVLQPIPFQKTATHKIKRFLYC